MPWARVDDGWWCHPKTLALDLEACGLWVRALSWSCAQRTPVIPPMFPTMVGGSEATAKQIEATGLWHGVGHDCADCDPVAEGWIVHNWSEYQQKTVSEKRAEAGRKGGLASGASRRVAKQTRSNAQPNAEAGTRPGPARTQPEVQTTSDAEATDTVKPQVSDDALHLSRQFAEAAKANGHGMPGKGSTAAKSWLVEMDRLLRLGPPGEGGHVPTPDEVAAVIRWCAADTGNGRYPGESATVRSVPKFRERYSELRRKAGFGGVASSKFEGGVPA